MTTPVYILIRTSNRPVFFKRMMETIKAQTYKNIVTIVHTDDPRDKYVEGDIIVKGCAYGSNYGDGTYNLYFNRLLNAIPDKPGYIHFIDDDDEYYSDDAIEKFVSHSKKDECNVARVTRWDNKIFPRHWGKQLSYQTECFMVHTDFKKKAFWWGNKGGDHHYSRQLTKQMPVNWIDDLIVCKLQECKGHGNRLDKNSTMTDYRTAYGPDVKVPVIGIKQVRIPSEAKIQASELKYMPYKLAYELEQKGLVKVTYTDLHTVAVKSSGLRI